MSAEPYVLADFSRAIYEDFEPESEDEDEEDDDEDESGVARNIGGLDLGDEEDDGGTGVLTSQLRHFVIQVSWQRL